MQKWWADQVECRFLYQNMSHFVIDTQTKLMEKLDLMNSLCDIKIIEKIYESAKDNTQD